MSKKMNDTVITLAAELQKRILQAVEEGFRDQLEFTRELVEIPSQMREEAAAQSYIAAAYRQRGLEVDRWELEVSAIADHPGFAPVNGSYDGVYNVVGTSVPENATGRSLILNGHIDVVPVGPEEQWSRPPYEAAIDGDWMYGRGSGDMKAGLVANLFALDALARAGYRPAAKVHLQSVVEEECTGNGTLACLVNGYDAEAVIIPEPMNEGLVRCGTGVVWFRIKILSTPAHAGLGPAGVNAIDYALDLIQALKVLEADWNNRKSEHPRYANAEKPINLNIGGIQGGDWASSVPACCTLECRVNYYPGTHAREWSREIVECIDCFVAEDGRLADTPPSVDFHGHFSSGFELQEGSEAEAVLRCAHQRVNQRKLESFPISAHVDATIYSIYGERPTLVYGPVSENIHSYNERVNLPSLMRVTKTISLFIAQWCGLEPL